MKKYISRNENISRTLKNHPRASKQKIVFMQPKGIMQAVLAPNAGCALSELLDDNKRPFYFTQATQDWYADHPEAGIADMNMQNVHYITNPRATAVNNRAELIAALNMKFMNDVTPIPNGFALSVGPLLPIQEFTFVLDQANVFHIAPNSSNSKFVHPTILGGWTSVNSAGTLKMDATHIKITNDSGHYRPQQADIDIAHTQLRTLLFRPGFVDKATNVRKFHKVSWLRNRPKYKKVAL